MTLVVLYVSVDHSVHWGINPSPTLKNTTPRFLAKPTLNWQTVQAPPF